MCSYTMGHRRGEVTGGIYFAHFRHFIIGTWQAMVTWPIGHGAPLPYNDHDDAVTATVAARQP